MSLESIYEQLSVDDTVSPFHLKHPASMSYHDRDGEIHSSLQFSTSSPFPSFSPSPSPSSTVTELVRRSGRNHSTSLPASSSGMGMQAELRIALYVAIFVLSVAGNALVALTIAQNRRMRTLTNVLLMNLSVADLLLAAFCMPFTLIPTLLRDFIFGHVVCILVRYMQGQYLYILVRAT